MLLVTTNRATNQATNQVHPGSSRLHFRKLTWNPPKKYTFSTLSFYFKQVHFQFPAVRLFFCGSTSNYLNQLMLGRWSQKIHGVFLGGWHLSKRCQVVHQTFRRGKEKTLPEINSWHRLTLCAWKWMDGEKKRSDSEFFPVEIGAKAAYFLRGLFCC